MMRHSAALEQEYVRLIESFASGALGATDFEREFLQLFSEHPPTFPSRWGSLVEEYMTSVDAFCADPSLRDENDIDEVQLLRDSRNVLARIAGLHAGGDGR